MNNKSRYNNNNNSNNNNNNSNSNNNNSNNNNDSNSNNNDSNNNNSNNTVFIIIPMRGKIAATRGVNMQEREEGEPEKNTAIKQKTKQNRHSK